MSTADATTPGSGAPPGHEPDASASPESQARLLTLAGLFLAGPLIWSVHFLVVYGLTESICASGAADAEWLGLDVASSLTVLFTVAAAAAALVPTRRAFRRWRAAGGDWNEVPPSRRRDRSARAEAEAPLALAGFLLGLLFVLAILFVGAPALVLDAC